MERIHKKESVGVIYKITNLVNGKTYVGQTTGTIRERFYCHSRSKIFGRNTTPITLAIKKYGKSNFITEKLKKCFSFETLDYWEKYYIKLQINSYNLEAGGNKRKKLHKSTKEKMSIANTKYAVYSKNIKTGEIKKWRNMMVPHRLDITDYRAIYACCIKKRWLKSSKGYMWFYSREEAKKAVYKNKALPKAVAGISSTGDKIIRFDSLKKAETEGGFMRSQVSLACRGLRGSYRGFSWKFASGRNI